MPFNRPSLGDLNDEVQSDIDARLPGTDPRLRRSFLGVLAAVLAGVAHGLYGFLDWIFRQLFPDTAEGVYLERWAGIWGIERLAATAATGSVIVTAAAGSVLEEGAVFRSGSGREYRTDAETRFAAASAEVAVTAAETGAAGNAAAGVRLTLTTTVSGVVGEAAVTAAGLAGGSDAESDADLLARLLIRLRQPPRGGAEGDYVFWARSAHPDVTNAWEAPLENGLGTVTLRFMAYGATDNGIPGAALVAAVTAYIEARAPVTADVTVAAPVAVDLDITIRNVMPDTAAVRAEIEAELADLVVREARPGGTIPLTHIAEAISTAAGEFDHELVAPAADVVVTASQISVLGDISWQTG